jgi:hypothetical protein
MSLLAGNERVVVAAIASLADGNPFLPERIESERRALGRAFRSGGLVWHADADVPVAGANEQLRPLVERLGNELRARLAKRVHATASELANYQGLIRYLLFQRYEDDWYALLAPAAGATAAKRIAVFDSFARDVDHFFHIPGCTLTGDGDAAHLFALGFQARRAFHHIFRQIFGASMPVARLRAAVWQSIFTHDPARYRRVLYNRMGDVPTLIFGESGSGKELVARAIALSRYIPFDARARGFVADWTDTVHAVNLSAVAPTLIESELFGHRRGAFTGAIADRSGWLETCGIHGSVFLDEIGELDLAIQVKLLRVLQTRTFQRIGEIKPRRFEGKVIAATNRDLDEEIDAARFRSDLYYRICADLIRTPTLREQLADAPSATCAPCSWSWPAAPSAAMPTKVRALPTRRNDGSWNTSEPIIRGPGTSESSSSVSATCLSAARITPVASAGCGASRGNLSAAPPLPSSSCSGTARWCTPRHAAIRKLRAGSGSTVGR